MKFLTNSAFRGNIYSGEFTQVKYTKKKSLHFFSFYPSDFFLFSCQVFPKTHLREYSKAALLFLQYF